jgi:hypothetical protein
VHDHDDIVFDTLASVIELGMRIHELLYLRVQLSVFGPKIVYEFRLGLLMGLLLKDDVV